MDGILVDSEPLWREAEKAGFAAVDLVLDDAMCESTMGMRTDEVVASWYRRQPWSGPSVAAVAADITARVGRLVDERGMALPGALAAVAMARAEGHRLALASSSAMSLIERVLVRLELGGAFAAVCSAEVETRGKPDPAVFLTAARALGVAPERCVVIEDSPTGVAAARAAGMGVVAVPAANQRRHPGFAAADHLLASLSDLTPAMLARCCHWTSGL
jgi:sugar-phosphatase